MSLRIGWFSTGRDPAARNLLETVRSDIVRNQIPASIEWIFCHRETGDGPLNEEYTQRELFFDLAASLDIPVATLSHVRFKPDLRKQGLAESVSAEQASTALLEWRNLFGKEVVQVVELLPRVDIVVMAGYMLIIGEPELEALKLVNIHPALPWGPKGTWQEVIHQLIREDSSEQGVMVHLVTSELDRGPCISCCKFGIRGEGWNDLWDSWMQTVTKDTSLEVRENHQLFRKIRLEGEKRELPLLRGAIRQMAFGNIAIHDRSIYTGGKPLQEGMDLTDAIEVTVLKEAASD